MVEPDMPHRFVRPASNTIMTNSKYLLHLTASDLITKDVDIPIPQESGFIGVIESWLEREAVNDAWGVGGVITLTASSKGLNAAITIEGFAHVLESWDATETLTALGALADAAIIGPGKTERFGATIKEA